MNKQLILDFKKENPETVKERVKKFRSKPGYSKIEITNTDEILKNKFLSVTGSSYREKLENLLLLWGITEPAKQLPKSQKEKPSYILTQCNFLNSRYILAFNKDINIVSLCNELKTDSDRAINLLKTKEYLKNSYYLKGNKVYIKNIFITLVIHFLRNLDNYNIEDKGLNIVYLINIKDNIYKIGFTNNLDRRLKSLKKSFPESNLIIVSAAYTLNARFFESYLHKYFQEQSAFKKEYFTLDNQMIENIFDFFKSLGDYYTSFSECGEVKQ